MKHEDSGIEPVIIMGAYGCLRISITSNSRFVVQPMILRCLREDYPGPICARLVLLLRQGRYDSVGDVSGR